LQQELAIPAAGFAIHHKAPVAGSLDIIQVFFNTVTAAV
jgi:hypothetical protein